MYFPQNFWHRVQYSINVKFKGGFKNREWRNLMKWLNKKPLVSSHTNFKINLEENVHMSSLPLTKENLGTHFGGRSQVCNFTIAKVSLAEEKPCALIGFGAGDLFPAVPLASAGLQGRQGLCVVTVRYMSDIKALLFGSLKSLCRSQQGLTWAAAGRQSCDTALPGLSQDLSGDFGVQIGLGRLIIPLCC